MFNLVSNIFMFKKINKSSLKILQFIILIKIYFLENLDD